MLRKSATPQEIFAHFKDMRANETYPGNMALTPTFDNIKEVYDRAADGAYDYEIAMMLGVCTNSFVRARKRFEEFQIALQSGRREFYMRSYRLKRKKIEMGSTAMLKHDLERMSKMKNSFDKPDTADSFPTDLPSP